MSIGRGAGLGAAAFAALALSLAIAPDALAGFKSGAYAGTTSQQTEIRFTATQEVAKEFSFKVTADCVDATVLVFEGKDAKAPISEKGRFSAEFVNKAARITAVVSGKLKHRRGSGTIETAGTLPSGVECESIAEWSARKLKPAAAG